MGNIVNAVEFCELRFQLLDCDLPIEEAVQEFLEGCEAEIDSLIEAETEGWEDGWDSVEDWDALEEKAAACWIKQNGGADDLEKLLNLSFADIAAQALLESDGLDDALNNGLGQIESSIRLSLGKYAGFYWPGYANEIVDEVRDNARVAIRLAVFEAFYSTAQVEIEEEVIDKKTSNFWFRFADGSMLTATQTSEDGDLELGEMDWANEDKDFLDERFDAAEAAARKAWLSYEG